MSAGDVIAAVDVRVGVDASSGAGSGAGSGVESDVDALIGVEVMMDDAGVGLDSTTSATTGKSAAAAVEVVGSGERRQYRSSSDHERSGIFSGASPNSSRRASWERGGRGREER